MKLQENQHQNIAKIIEAKFTYKVECLLRFERRNSFSFLHRINGPAAILISFSDDFAWGHPLMRGKDYSEAGCYQFAYHCLLGRETTRERHQHYANNRLHYLLRYQTAYVPDPNTYVLQSIAEKDNPLHPKFIQKVPTIENVTQEQVIEKYIKTIDRHPSLKPAELTVNQWHEKIRKICKLGI